MMKKYSEFDDPDEVIEVRLGMNDNARKYVGHVNERGVVVHVLMSSNGTPLGFEYVGVKRTDMPGKAVVGWQAEMLALLEAGGSEILEVR